MTPNLPDEGLVYAKVGTQPAIIHPLNEPIAGQPIRWLEDHCSEEQTGIVESVDPLRIVRM